MYNQEDEDDFIASASDEDVMTKLSFSDSQGPETVATYQDNNPNGPSTIITRTKTAVELLEEKHHALKAENLIKSNIKKQALISQESIENQEDKEEVPVTGDMKNITAAVSEIQEQREGDCHIAETENKTIPISEYKFDRYIANPASEKEYVEEKSQKLWGSALLHLRHWMNLLIALAVSLMTVNRVIIMMTWSLRQTEHLMSEAAPLLRQKLKPLISQTWLLNLNI